MDIDAGPAERIPHDQELQKSRVVYRSNSSGPVIIQSAAVLEAVKARPGNVGVRFYGEATADLDSLCARRPNEIYGRDGRKPCGAVEQKKAPKQERS
jgi:hypothetical protein